MSHETPTTANQRLIISVLFIRAHQSSQAAITLVENGMLADARVVLSRAVEGAMALNVLVNDATFDMQLIEAHLHNQRKTARIVLNTPEYRSGYAAAEIAQMAITIKEVSDKEAAAGREFRDITWATVGCKPLSRPVQPPLSLAVKRWDAYQHQRDPPLSRI